MPRLQIAPYNRWNEALHGVARAGKATVFPRATAMAASFNKELMYGVATAISTERRKNERDRQLVKKERACYL
jgi:beta-glucosidase